MQVTSLPFFSLPFFSLFFYSLLSCSPSLLFLPSPSHLSSTSSPTLPGADRTLVFVETKRNADYLASLLSQEEFPTTSIHG